MILDVGIGEKEIYDLRIEVCEFKFLHVRLSDAYIILCIRHVLRKSVIVHTCVHASI